MLVQGNVGIGTAVPKNKLDIEGGMVIGATYSGTNTAPSNGLLVQGNVGIGTTNPGASQLYIQNKTGNANVSIYGGNGGVATGKAILSFATSLGSGNTTTGLARIEIQQQASSSNTDFVFFTRKTDGTQTEKMRIDGDGNVDIGTANPITKLHIDQGTSSVGLRLQRSSYYWDVRVSSSNHLDLIKNGSSSSTVHFYGSTSCEIGNFSGSISCSSDRRLKKDFKPIDNLLEKIQLLNGTYFSWIKGDNNKQRVGLIAQNVEKVFPEVVSTGEDGFKSVAYASLIVPVIEAVKELNSKVEDLQNTNASLMLQNEMLMQRLDRLEKVLIK